MVNEGRVWRIDRVYAFRPKGHIGSTTVLAATQVHARLGQVLHSQLPMALRREIPAHVSVSGAPLSSSEPAEALYK